MNRISHKIIPVKHVLGAINIMYARVKGHYLSSVILICTVFFFTPAAHGEFIAPTLMLGYQYVNIDNYGHASGPVFMYKTNSAPLSFVGKLTAAKHYWQNQQHSCNRGDTKCQNAAWSSTYNVRNAEYFSALFGPAYRLTDAVSLFGLAGISHTKIEDPFEGRKDSPHLQPNKSHSSNHMAYTIGLAFSPYRDLSIDLGYEMSHTTFNEKEHFTGSRFFTVGYKFK